MDTSRNFPRGFGRAVSCLISDDVISYFTKQGIFIYLAKIIGKVNTLALQLKKEQIPYYCEKLSARTWSRRGKARQDLDTLRDRKYQPIKHLDNITVAARHAHDKELFTVIRNLLY